MSERSTPIPGPDWHTLTEGERLPELRFPITLKTLMLEIAGTRDFMPYHWHREFTKGKGIRDSFVNTMFFQALFGRYVTDWAGIAADLRSATLQMFDQICPGDTAVVQGQVDRTWSEGDDSLVQVTAEVSNHIGRGARSTLVLAMPTAARPVVSAPSLGEYAAGELDSAMPAEARTALHKKVRVDAPYPVSEQQIAQFCAMVRDSNPHYLDPGFAATGRHGGLIAPPQALMIWTMPEAGQCGVDPAGPDVDLPDQEPWPAPATDPFDFKAPGATDVIATNQVVTFGTPVRPGDRLYMLSGLANCTALKQTKLGRGYFVTTLQETYNQHDELVGRNVITVYQYGVPA